MKHLGKLALVAGFALVGLPGSDQSVSAADKTYITIGTGGPTGVYFVSGNAICRMVHKEAAEGRDTGRKHNIPLFGTVVGRFNIQYCPDH